jgi:hypothetical protein
MDMDVNGHVGTGGDSMSVLGTPGFDTGILESVLMIDQNNLKTDTNLQREVESENSIAEFGQNKHQRQYAEDLKAHKGPEFANPTGGPHNDWLNKPFMEDGSRKSVLETSMSFEEFRETIKSMLTDDNIEYSSHEMPSG